MTSAVEGKNLLHLYRLVYPTLLATVGDVVHPSWRASSVGVYRLWRDLGYAVGAVLVGQVADRVGMTVAMWVVAVLTFMSGVAAAFRMTETLRLGNHITGERSNPWLLHAR
jgi:predicted MFS family arabinose efflux permease